MQTSYNHHFYSGMIIRLHSLRDYSQIINTGRIISVGDDWIYVNWFDSGMWDILDVNETTMPLIEILGG